MSESQIFSLEHISTFQLNHRLNKKWKRSLRNSIIDQTCCRLWVLPLWSGSLFILTWSEKSFCVSKLKALGSDTMQASCHYLRKTFRLQQFSECILRRFNVSVMCVQFAKETEGNEWMQRLKTNSKDVNESLELYFVSIDISNQIFIDYST